MLVTGIIAALFLFSGVSAKLHHRNVVRADPTILGKIGIYLKEHNSLWGYITMDQQEYRLGWEGHATIFSMPSGQNTGISLKHQDLNGMYLAGVTPPDTNLGNDPNARAILKPGKVGFNATVDGLSETAIWSYDASSGRLTPHWINDGSSEPVEALIYYVNYDHFYLSGAPTGKSTDFRALMTFAFEPTKA